MPRSMGQTVISYLYKKEDREVITNWRLILLLKYENKIYTKTLANKIQLTLDDVIGPEQVAAKKERTTIVKLQLNRDVMSYANTSKIPAAMIVLDQEKVFDRVDWNSLLKAPQHFGYGPEIIRPPLSMILYIIFAEIFLENIRQNNHIKGSVIGGKELNIHKKQ